LFPNIKESIDTNNNNKRDKDLPNSITINGFNKVSVSDEKIYTECQTKIDVQIVNINAGDPNNETNLKTSIKSPITINEKKVKTNKIKSVLVKDDELIQLEFSNVTPENPNPKNEDDIAKASELIDKMLKKTKKVDKKVEKVILEKPPKSPKVKKEKPEKPKKEKPEKVKKEKKEKLVKTEPIQPPSEVIKPVFTLFKVIK